MEGEIYRAVDEDCAGLFRNLDTTGVLDILHRRGRLVRTRSVRQEEPIYESLRRHIPGFATFLHHEKVPFVSYPYEWSQSMLADAAVCCLDLELLLIEHGYSLKDASAYNVQWICGRPVFIDVPSIETVRRRDVWTALDQFYRMFLYPLLLKRSGKTDLKGYFLAHLDGMESDEVFNRFGRLGACRPAALLDVALPHFLQCCSKGGGAKLRHSLKADRADPRALVMNLKRLRSKIESISNKAASGSRWTDYARANTYGDEALALKQSFVKGFIERHPVKNVLDIGCNTGSFTEPAIEAGAGVVAVDSDAACVDALYRRARENKWNVTPLVMDIANPSPAMGFRHAERASFTDRASFDCVFALALLHHLLIASRLPLAAIRDMLAELTGEYLIVEFVGPGDEMFQSFLAARENLYGELTVDRFLSVFGERFETIEHQRVTDHRLLLACRKLR
jgi:SAM-dependent methyltransferase